MRRRALVRGAIVGSSVVLVAAFMGQSAGAATASGALHGAAAAPAVATHTASTAKMGTIALVHVTHPRSLRAPTSQQQRQVRTLPLLRLNQAKYQPGAAPSVKGAVGKSIPAGGSVFRNFDGVDAIQNRDTAGFNLEPPDEGLGAGNGYVANFVNVTGAVYSDRGFLLAGPFYLNRFFGESDDANTSDPRVFYDQGTKTWIATILEY